MVNKRLRIVVGGELKEEFFKKNIEEKANQLKLTGYIKTCPDSCVEILLEGDDSQLNEMVRYCKQGPTFAKIKHIDVNEEEFEDEFSDFFIKS